MLSKIPFFAFLGLGVALFVAIGFFLLDEYLKDSIHNQNLSKTWQGKKQNRAKQIILRLKN
jgi:hypothetical protein